MIEVRGLKKRFGQVKALDGISFKISKGEIVGLLGPNAAGKTTTLNILAGVLPPSAGQVLIDGQDLEENPLELKQKIGFLPENNPLYEDMNVYEYLEFIANSRKIVNFKGRIKEVVEICKLQDVISRNISELSKGYRQRVGFAASIIHNPKILILDEPTSGLDPNQAQEVRNLISEFKKDKTIILSTHILSEVEEIADYVVIIHKGKIVAEGNIAELNKMVLKNNIIRIAGRFNKDLENYLPNIVSGIYQISLVSETSEGIKEYEIETEKDLDIREDLYNLSVKEGWKLIELHKTSASLQDVFRELTRE